MKVSQECIKLIKDFEGCYLNAYLDPVGVITIGYGTTNADEAITGLHLELGVSISQEQADSFLMESLNRKYIPLVDMYNNVYHFNQNQIDALVSFCYNIGSIKQLTDDGKRSISEISEKILAYNKAGGNILNGLVRRRKAEKELFDRQTEVKREEYVMSLLTFGSKGNDVTIFESIMKKMGYYNSTIDQSYGNGCVEACKSFQRDHGLVEDGKCGSNTWSSIFSIMRG